MGLVLRLAHALAGAALAGCAATATVVEADRPARAELLIVAPAALAPAVRPYADARAGELATDLVLLEDMLAAHDGADDPERLKRALHAAWRDRGTRYVLLVGDADVMPIRFMVLDRNTEPAFHYAFYASDLYYADVARADGSFDDWNAVRDGFHAGYVGEVRGEHFKDDPINYDQVDYRPELAVGRWPASTAEEVAHIAAKSLRHAEAHAREAAQVQGVSAPASASVPVSVPVSASVSASVPVSVSVPASASVPAPTHRRAALIHHEGWVDARDRLDRLAEQLAPRWSVERRYDGSDTPAPTPEELERMLDAGTGLLIHVGHGFPSGWHRGIGTASLARLEAPDPLPVMLSAGCSTAEIVSNGPYLPYTDVDGVEHAGTNAGEVFDAPPPPPAPYQRGACNVTSMGEEYVRAAGRGAVAYIGCNTGGQPCAITLLEGFVAALAEHDDPRLGDCWREAVLRYHVVERTDELVPTESWYPPSVFYQPMKYMVFGDPSLRMAGTSVAAAR